MLFGSAATINSFQSSPSDHDFALILLIMGVIMIGAGAGVIDIEAIKNAIPLPESVPQE